MSVRAKSLFDPLRVPAADTVLYTAPAGVRVILDKFTGSNTTGVAATLRVNLVPSGGSVGVANQTCPNRSINGGEVYTFPEIVGHVLNPGDQLVANAGTASAISVRASGREVAE